MKYGISLLLFLTFAVSSFSTSETLKFAFSDFPPFEYSEKDQIKGINIEIIQEACNRLNIKPIFIELPWKRALEIVRKGKMDAVFSLFKNDERIKHFSFPNENLNTVRMTILVDHKSDIEIDKWSDLTNKRVGVFLGSSYGERFDNDKTIIKVRAPTNASLLWMQAAGRVDFTIIDERVGRFWSQKLEMENKFKFLNFIIVENPTYVAFSTIRGHTHWAVQFSDVLKTMKEDGFIKEINKIKVPYRN